MCFDIKCTRVCRLDLVIYACVSNIVANVFSGPTLLSSRYRMRIGVSIIIVLIVKLLIYQSTNGRP